ncbi:MAG: hypothetical protein Q8Q32_00235 [bacterium]|nr:hypothetical protein [bacterium]
MKNKKLLILLIIVLLIIIAMVVSRNTEDGDTAENGDEMSEDQLQDDAALMDGANGAVAGATDANLVGVWRSSEDPKYILEFAADGVVREYYARQLTATGSWSLKDGVLSTRIGGAARSYDLTELSESNFSARYQTSDVTISFARVAGY